LKNFQNSAAAGGNRLAAELREAILHVGRLDRLQQRVFEARERLFRRFVRREQAEPGAELKAGEAAFGEGGNVGEGVGAARAGHGEGLHLSALDVARRRPGKIEQHRHAARDEVRVHRAAAFVGNVHELDVGRGAEELAREVAARARSRGAVSELARLLASARNDVLKVSSGILA
jgi:hypothetical protein